MSTATRSLLVQRPETPAGLIAIPLRTPLVRPGDDLPAMVAQAACGIARAGDVIAVSETAVAIAQGELLAAESVRPSKLAFVLSRRADPMATISQPESMQLVIDRIGVWKIVAATLLQLLGRLFGRRGLFYHMVGDAIAAVDGYTGTMPPYERAIVFAPRDPDGVAETVARQTGVACAVVDANDLGTAKVLGASGDVRRAIVAAALFDNPHGNSDEQTPLVVLKWRGHGENPLHRGSES
ncbi:MAG: coenzyme F420-0:L-glutamate ligase [Candidatus Eremiobacteraeota bacterium]|nr:coenzyme F420-0:L-glutamate ligase [Candidatus Eremiobacteraeota bacterium]